MYTITHLSDELIFIVWKGTPSRQQAEQFLADIEKVLEEATQPVYFLSDLRKGRINDVMVLERLSHLARHPMWGNGASFSSDPTTWAKEELFATLVKSSGHDDSIWDSPEQAIAYLNHLKPGITAGIDFQAIIEK